MMAGSRSPHGAINTIDLRHLLYEALMASGKIVSLCSRKSNLLLKVCFYQMEMTACLIS